MKTRKKNRTKTGPLLLILFGVLLIIATFSLLSTINKPAAASKPASALFPLDQISRIDISESKLAYDNNQAVLLDVRSQAAYDAQRIKGAVNIPLSELETRYQELDPEAWIITYCT
ncbi:MAG: hypothetical protein IT308_12770 [Anaerolineaceae bacterium]|nr:hypothetical protein [Anaerolineaceae bacterium]